MTQFQSVNYICLVYKLKFVFWTDLWLLYLELYFLILFRDCGNLLFDKIFFKILYLCFLFIHKTAELVLEKLPRLRSGCSRKLTDSLLNNIFNPFSIGLEYTLSFEWPDFGQKCLLTAMLKSSATKIQDFPYFWNRQYI